MRRCCHEKLLTAFSRIRALVLRSSRTVNHNPEFFFFSCEPSFTSDKDPSTRCSFAKLLLSGKITKCSKFWCRRVTLGEHTVTWGPQLTCGMFFSTSKEQDFFFFVISQSRRTEAMFVLLLTVLCILVCTTCYFYF